MTLAQAVGWLSPDWPVVGCACVGPAPGDRLCSCHRATVEARALHRAAHITARLLADVASRAVGRVDAVHLVVFAFEPEPRFEWLRGADRRDAGEGSASDV